MSEASTLGVVPFLVAAFALLSSCSGATEEDVRAIHDRLNRLEQRLVVLEVHGEEASKKSAKESGRMTKTATSSADDASPPEWVEKGSRALSIHGKRVFHGVGSATGITNQALAVATANNRAHSEVARLLETCFAKATKRIGAQAKPRKRGGTSLDEGLRTISAAILSGVEIVDHWIHPTSGTIYALARLDLAGVRGATRTAPKEMKPKAKKQIDRAIEEAFQEMTGGE